MHGNRRLTNEDRFHKFYEKIFNGCWEWQKSLDKDGYGKFWWDGKTRLAHQFSWDLYFGDRNGMCVCHTCDNPACVNPNHLFLGTNFDNIKDRDKKNRQVKGEKQHLSKLNPDKIRQIRKDSRTNKEIANNYGIAESNVSFIKSKITWKWVED